MGRVLKPLIVLLQ